MFLKTFNTITKISPVYLLLLILLLTLALRAFAWFYFGTYLFGENGRSDFHDLLEYASQGDWNNVINDGRFYQPIYPLLWLPAFNSSFESLYLFTLHQIFSIGSVCLVYLTGKKIFGVYFGLIAALLLAINIEIIFWFSWAYADNAFYFFLALLAFTATNLFYERKLINYIYFILSSVLCFLTRPEGLFVVLTAIFILLFINLSQKLSLKKSFFIVVTLVLLFSSALLSSIFLNKKTQDVFLNNFHFGLALYVSSNISSNSPEEQNYIYSVKMDEDVKKYREKKFNNWNRCEDYYCSRDYILATIGLEFIKENPLQWLKMYSERLISNIFPAFFSPQWSLTHKLYNFFFSFCLVVGGCLALFYKDPRRFQALALTLMAIILILVINFFQREIDYRVPLSMHILFSVVAPYGWYKFFSNLKKSY